MKIGIFGGTFDPIHNGHINAIVESYLKLQLDKMIVIPTYLSPFKESVNTSSESRLEMISLSLNHYDFIDIDTFEILGEQTSYTYDTLLYLKEKWPNDDLYFIIGTDQYQSFKAWRNSELLHDLAQFVIINREDTDIEIHAPFIPLKINTVEVSSTLIRQRLKDKIETRHLLNHNVYQYIKEHHLYEAQGSRKGRSREIT